MLETRDKNQEEEQCNFLGFFDLEDSLKQRRAEFRKLFFKIVDFDFKFYIE